MTQKEAIKRLKEISRKIGMTSPKLWAIQVNAYSITKGDIESPIYDYDREEIVKENNLNFEKIQDFLNSRYRNDCEALAEIEEFEDFEDIRYFLFKHDSDDDQDIYGLVNIHDNYTIDETIGVFLTEEECRERMQEQDYREGSEEMTDYLYANGELKELLRIVRDTEWEE